MKNQSSCNTQGDPEVSHKRVGNYQWKDAEYYPDQLKIYEGNSKAWYFVVISLIYTPFGLVRQCNENAHETWKALIDKYEVSDEKQESLNEMSNRCKNCRINYTSQDPAI